MNSVERVMKTLSGEIPDRVPMYDFLFQKDLYTELIGVTPDDYDLVAAIDCSRALDLDMVAGMVGAPEEFEADISEEGVYIDEWGTTYVRNKSSWPVDAPVEFPIKDASDFASFRFPDPTAKGRFANLEEGIAYGEESIAISAGTDGPFTKVWMLMGPEELLVQMFTHPDFIKDLINEVTDYFIEMSREVKRLKPHMYSISEDLGSSTGSMISPDMFREFVLPPLQRLIDALDMPIFFHSCGQITELLDDIVGMGISALHPLQRTAGMDIAHVKETYGDKITIVGNIDSSGTLPYGTPDDVEQEVLETLEIAKPGGHFMLASDHSLHDGIPVENIKRLFETGLKHGVYV